MFRNCSFRQHAILGSSHLRIPNMAEQPCCLKPVNPMADSEVIIAGRNGDIDRLRRIFIDLFNNGHSKDEVRKIFERHSNKLGKTVLHEAAQNSREDCVRYLVQKDGEVGMDPDCLKQGDWTPLMLACTKSSLDAIRTLVEAGAALDLRNKDGWTPFHIACREGHEDIIAYLLSLESAQLWRTKSKNGRTPLHTAALYGRDSIVRLLLAQKACSNVDDPDSCGSTPLMDALRAGHIEIAKCLIENRADPYKADALGRQPIHLAAQAGCDESIRFLVELHKKEDLETSSLVNTPTKDGSGSTPAHFGAKEGHVSTLKLLKSYGALLDSSDSKGRNPLHMAAISQRIECVQYLLSEGVHDIPDAQGVRPSQLAKKPEVKQAFENSVDTT